MDYQRVTEILYPFSGMKYIDPTVLENAATRGTRVHNICEGIIKGIEGWPIPEEIQGYIDSFNRWWGRGRKYISVEERMYCDKLKITGKADLILKGDTIVDFKTSMNESKTWKLQGSAYAYLARLKGYNINKILFLRLRRDGSTPKEHVYEEDMQLFTECLNVYRYFYGKKGRSPNKKSSK